MFNVYLNRNDIKINIWRTYYTKPLNLHFFLNNAFETTPYIFEIQHIQNIILKKEKDSDHKWKVTLK